MKDEGCDPCCVFRLLVYVYTCVRVYLCTCLPVYLGAFANSTKRHYNRRTFNLELMEREIPHPRPLPIYFVNGEGSRVSGAP